LTKSSFGFIWLVCASLTIGLGCSPPENVRCQAEIEAENLFTKIKSEYRTHDLAWREWRAIEELGEDAAPALIRLIEGNTLAEMNGQSCSDAEMKIGALSVLGRWKYKPAFDLVEECARGNEHSIRPWAMSILEDIDHARAYPVIVELVSDPNTQVRIMAAKVLASYPERDNCALYKILIGDPQALVRAEAGARLLFSRKCPEAKAWIEEIITNEEDFVTKSRLKGALEMVYGVSAENAE
jgi:HEAT repeat protein